MLFFSMKRQWHHLHEFLGSFSIQALIIWMKLTQYSYDYISDEIRFLRIIVKCSDLIACVRDI